MNEKIIDIGSDGQPEGARRLLTLEEVAMWLALPEAAIKRILKSGKLHGFRVLGRLRFERSEVERFLKGVRK